MRSRLTAVFAISLLATACGGGSPTGTTTGVGATSSGTTTGAGTTTGGAALKDGVTCSANSDCSSGLCGVNGSGRCCHASCGDAGGVCDATACDSSGSCSFPSSGAQCQSTSCASGKVTAYQCNGAGSCVAQAANTCSNHLGCSSDGMTCATTCGSSAECGPNYVCNAGACVGGRTVGTCTENDDCYSGRCGLDGGGHCCVGSTACNGSDPTCGATDCNPVNGSCRYADAGTSCGSTPQSCVAGIEQDASACDGKGSCATAAPFACIPFICGANACLSSCTDSTSCGVGAFCDTGNGICCPGLADGASITVDGTSGSDATPCCSLPGHGTCQSITAAMKHVDLARAQNVTLNAVVRQGNTWVSPTEVYPVVLGWGAELSAPGVFFDDGPDAGNQNIFEVKAVSPNDTLGYASITGSAKRAVTIGEDEFRNQSGAFGIIQVDNGNTLYLANALVVSNANVQSNAVTVAAGGSLVLAQDQSGANAGTVTIGHDNLAQFTGTWGYNGIVCKSSQTAGCTITDTQLDGGASSLVIRGQENLAIDAEDFSNVTLASSPLIGIPAGDAGFGVCSQKVDGEQTSGASILLHGTASMSFSNGFIQCLAADAFDLTASSNGVPTLTVGNTTIENVNTAINAFAGSATVAGSTIQFNGNGVAQTTDGKNVGSVDLNGGDAGNTIVCSESAESRSNKNGSLGVSVSNNTSSSLDADNVTWDTPAPDRFRCNATLSSCACQVASCSLWTGDGGIDGMDAVEIGDAGTITTAGNQLSAVNCNFKQTTQVCSILCKPPTFCCIVGMAQECCN